MRQRHLLIAITCSVFIAIVFTGVGTADGTLQSDNPNISVFHNGSRIDSQERYIVGSDPTIRIDSWVSDGSLSQTDLKTITVRINGQTHRNYKPNSDTFSRNLNTSLKQGQNSITIIAEDTNEAVSSTSIYIIKDTHPPSVTFTKPVFGPAGRVSADVSHSVVNITAQIRDYSGISHAQAKAMYAKNVREDSADQKENADPHFINIITDSWEKTNVSDTLSGDLVVNKGNSTIQIKLIDEWGNTGRYRLPITLKDPSSPEIDLRPFPEITDNRHVVLQGNVSDGVWVKNMTMNVSHVRSNYTSQHTILRNKSYQPTRERISTAFEYSLPLRRGLNIVNISAYDQNGSVTTVSRSVLYNSTINQKTNNPPQIGINQKKTLLINKTTIDIVGSVKDRDGGISIIEMESWHDTTIFGYESVNPHGNPGYHPIRGTLQVPSSKNTITIYAIDDEDVMSQHSFQVNTFNVSIDEEKTSILNNGSVKVTSSVDEYRSSLDVIIIQAKSMETGEVLDKRVIKNPSNGNPVSLLETLEVGNRSVLLSVNALTENGDRSVDTLQIEKNASSTGNGTLDNSEPKLESPKETDTSNTRPTTDNPPTTNKSTQPNTAKSSILAVFIGFVMNISPFVVGGVMFVVLSFFTLKKYSASG